MTELTSNTAQNIVVTEVHRQPHPPEHSVETAVDMLRTAVPVENIAVDPNAGIATLSVPKTVNIDALRKLLGENFVVGPNSNLNF